VRSINTAFASRIHHVLRTDITIVPVSHLVPGVIQGVLDTWEEMILAHFFQQSRASNRIHELLLHPGHEQRDALGLQTLGQVPEDLLTGRIELFDRVTVENDVLQLGVVGEDLQDLVAAAVAAFESRIAKYGHRE